MTKSSTTAKTSDEQASEKKADTVKYDISSGLAAWLKKHKCSIAFTSYQSGLLYSLGQNPNGGAHIHQTAIPRAMGITYHDDGRVTLIGQNAIIQFENILNTDERINHSYDVCFVPRRLYMTGYLDAHDVGVDKDGDIIFVNTRFNCLAKPSPRHSFKPIWKPDFISEIIDEDRCHLNGLAIRDGEAAYVTAVSRSNTIDGWRERRKDGGIVIDIKSGKIVCEGLSMPHSPRWFNGELWVANSGTGQLGVVKNIETGKGTFEPRFFCPGFIRGVTIYNGHAIIGLSKPRYKRFEGLELDQKLKEADSEAWCGLQIFDLAKGSCVNWLNIDSTEIGELYDVAAIPNFQMPIFISPSSQEISSLITIDA